MPSWGVGRRGHWEPGRMTLPCGRQSVASSNVWGRPEPQQPAPLSPAHGREYRVQEGLGGGPIRTRLWPQCCGLEAMLLIHSSLSKEPEWSSAQPGSCEKARNKCFLEHGIRTYESAIWYFLKERRMYI